MRRQGTSLCPIRPKPRRDDLRPDIRAVALFDRYQLSNNWIHEVRLLELSFLHECSGQTDDFFRLQIQGEMSRIENMHFGNRIIFSIGFTSGYGKRGVISTPKYQE